MSSIDKARQGSPSLWLSALLAWAGLATFALMMPLLTGLHAQLPEPIRSLAQKISYDKAVADSLAGKAVIIDLRPAEVRKQKPVPGSAIHVPEKPNGQEWDKLAPLLESLQGTPVYLIFPRQGDHPAHFKLMSYQLDLWSVEMTP
jgi:hypothetical protein